MSKKVLIIEDEVLIQKSLKKLLERRGADVTVKSTGRSAIDSIFNNDYDKILCDLMLNDIHGFDIIEDSKRKYNSKEIQDLFIIMTAYSSEAVLEKASGYKCKILHKPFEDLKLVLDTVMQ